MLTPKEKCWLQVVFTERLLNHNSHQNLLDYLDTGEHMICYDVAGVNLVYFEGSRRDLLEDLERLITSAMVECDRVARSHYADWLINVCSVLH
jgi:hypothetical protein